MLDNLCSMSPCCKTLCMHYLLSQPVYSSHSRLIVLCNLFHQIYCEDLCWKSPWTQRSFCHDALQHQTKDICLKSTQYTLYFPPVYVLWFGDSFIPSWQTLSPKVQLLIALSVNTSFSSLFTSLCPVHPSPWSCNDFSRCFFEVADRSYCVAADVSCVLGFCLCL